MIVSPNRRTLQAIQMLVSKVVNLQEEELLHKEELLHILLPPLYAFLRWSFASLHWKLDKGDPGGYFLPSMRTKMDCSGLEDKFKISNTEALYRTLDIWETVLSPTMPAGTRATEKWLQDSMASTALFHTVVLYDAFRVLLVNLKATHKKCSARGALTYWTPESHELLLIERIDRLLDRPVSTHAWSLLLEILDACKAKLDVWNLNPYAWKVTILSLFNIMPHGQEAARRRPPLERERWHFAISLRRDIVDYLRSGKRSAPSDPRTRSRFDNFLRPHLVCVCVRVCVQVVCACVCVCVCIGWMYS